MAFTAPTTRATDFLVTAAIWNAEHVDNFNTAVEHLHARKTAAENVTTTTLQDDDNFQLTVAANEVWKVRLSLLVITGAGGMKSAWSFPASGNLYGFSQGGGVSVDFQNQRQTASDTPTVDYIANNTTGRLYHCEAVFVNAGTGGTLIWRNALSTASGTSTVSANSTMWVVKLA